METPEPVPPTSQADQDLPPYAHHASPPSTSANRRELTDHVYHLYNSKNKPWASLKVRSTARSNKFLPVYYEGEPINGEVELNFEKEERIKAVSLMVMGRLISTAANGDKTFLKMSHPLWSASQGPPSSEPQSNRSSPVSSNEQVGKLLGKYTWPFTITMPKDVAMKGRSRKEQPKAYRLPPTFLVKNIHFTVQYELLVHIQRPSLHIDNKLGTVFGYTPCLVAPPPSPIRQIAYQENTALVGPEDDPAGWTTLAPLHLQGSIFNTRPLQASCTVSIAKPLCYTRGGTIPLVVLISSPDSHALDLLSTPKFFDVQLIRHVGFDADFYRRRSDAGHATKLGTDATTSDESVAKAVWWPSPREDDRPGGKRRLEGEIHLSGQLHPSCIFDRFLISYSLVIYPPSAPGIALTGSGDLKQPLSLAQRRVEVVTAYPRGPRPRRYAPPGYDDGDDNSGAVRGDILGVIRV
ncbi:hypothetical protein JAAARDRAFT_35575 [Jaapia argillacea MUCL 33604]|uniref:Arrestin-like N-terminal domain-containing protein n=1 Tax=Jaapia argillacea MUCL 33604 TaxID=933084 RepID=A0A067Q317_9AGAM|nr:hypothetical protein JAAARDRAFT_35575 [Jaapia argillacea MUCL 33604]